MATSFLLQIKAINRCEARLKWMRREGRCLNREGAVSMSCLEAFCLEHRWPGWQSLNGIFVEGEGSGALRKLAVRIPATGEILIYFPDASATKLNFDG